MSLFQILLVPVDEGGFPAPPSGYLYVIDDEGNYVIDDNEAYVIAVEP